MRSVHFALFTLMLVLATATVSWSQSNEQVLHNFAGGADGANPLADLLFDPSSGFLYGTTNKGGGSAGCTMGCGTVFAIHPDGTGYSIIYSFAGSPNGDGANPQAGLVIDPAGNLYGTTYNGGANNRGAVFRLSPVGGGQFTETVLFSFGGTRGTHPTARLILDGVGNLYGTTSKGGARGDGVVFKLIPTQSPPWHEVVLHSFTGPDGANPRAGVVFDANNNLWGTTYHGGQSSLGTVFRLGSNGAETFLFSFSGADGANPRASVTFDSAGDVFSTTQFGGSPACAFVAAGCGAVFELTPVIGGGFQETVIYSFTGGMDGAAPLADLALVPDMTGVDLYGTASQAGNIGGICTIHGCGTAFELCGVNTSCAGNGAWTEYTLYDFKLDMNGRPGGRTPAAGLVIPGAPRRNEGDIPMGRGSCTSACYGTNSAGGSNNSGTVVQLMGP